MRALLLCSVCMCWLFPGSAARAQGLPHAALEDAALGTGEAIVDVNSVDPESFRAVGTRLRSGETVVVDGRLNDEAWSRVERYGRFIQREPAVGRAASETTEFSIVYDDRCIYFAVWAFDSDYHHIQASELKRDASLRKGDQVKIILDTFRDRQNGYFFSTNPLGALKDAQHIDNGRTINMDWNAVWEVKTSTDERGWYAEIRIPFSQLRFGTSDDQVWGLNVSRVVIRKNEDSYWVPFPREWGTPGFSRVRYAGSLNGLRGIRTPRRFEAVPFVSPTASTDSQHGAPKDARVGFDLRTGLTPTLTADVTYHTDFAQVEADEETVNLTRFSLFFPEKRQFFTEAAGIFGYGAAVDREPHVSPTGPQEPGLMQLFHSRRIGQLEGQDIPIRIGARLTGRTGAYQIGVMNIQTASATLGTDATVPVAGNNFTVLRVKRDLPGGSSVGAIALNRQSADDFNRAAGLDLNLALGKRGVLTGLVAKTSTPGRRGKDLAAAVDVLMKTDRWITGFTYADVPERFNAEMGFIRRTDVRHCKAKAGWTPRPGWRGVRQLAFTTTGELFRDHGGLTISQRETADFLGTFTDSSTLQLTWLRDYDRLKLPWTVGASALAPGGYRWETGKATFTSNQSKRVFGSLGIETGSYYGGDKRTYKVSANFNPVSTLLLETTVQRSRLRFADTPTYTALTLSSRVSYSFSPELFVKSFVQYNSDRKLATANLLLWYVYRPGSDLYLVYNHGWDTDLPDRHFARTRARSLTLKATFWISR